MANPVSRPRPSPTSGLRWDEHPFMLKHLADRHFAQGINHLVFHTYTHNPLDRRAPAPPSAAGSAPRSCAARPGGSTCRCSPNTLPAASSCSSRAGRSPTCSGISATTSTISRGRTRPFPDGYQFDYLNQDVLLNRLEVADGVFRSPEGLTWKVLWLPPDRNLRLAAATLGRLRELLDAGGTVIANPPVGKRLAQRRPGGRAPTRRAAQRTLGCAPGGPG